MQEILPRLVLMGTGVRRSGRAKNLAGLGQELGAAAIGLQAVVSNANKASGQDVEQEAADEF